jgi:hypothetical protein
MAHKRRHSEPKSTPPAAVVLFGLDDSGKPKAAQFPGSDVKLALKAADQLRLRVLTVAKPAIAALAAKLPAGRIHANGGGLIPRVRPDVYNELVAAAENGDSPAEPGSQSPAGARSNGHPPNGNSGAAGQYPKDWDSIAPGHTVVAQDAPEDGWYDAIVVARTGDMCTLRWRDYPRGRFTRHFRTLALRCPAPDAERASATSTATNKAAKSPGKASGTGQPKSSGQGLPATWADVDVGHLVLAMCDGPWESWWEAVPTQNRGATLTLQWRDYRKLPEIERSRFSLALLCPTTG